MMSASRIDIRPLFIEGTVGQIFAIHYLPVDRSIRGHILFCPPFAEEMHKSRRMTALQARAFAQAGYSVLQHDLYGCGDSEGDFADARWEIWLADTLRASNWLVEQAHLPMYLWGLRTGCLLACEMSGLIGHKHDLILWQPVAQGEHFLNQFLRQKLASEMLNEGRSQTGLKTLRQQLADGDALEIGGYELSDQLAKALVSRRMENMRPEGHVYWLEVAGQTDMPLSPSSNRVVEVWQSHGTDISTIVVQGDPFWSSQEIVECPALIQATANIMSA